MCQQNILPLQRLLVAILWLASCAVLPHQANGNELLLTWHDNSDNEEGFQVERKSGTDAYQLRATLGRNVTSFLDTVTELGERLCYRVRAFNTAGASEFSNEVCSVALTVQSGGTGAGSITGPGIDCPPDCSENFAENASVTLTASPSPNSTFSGWSGDQDCSDGVVTMDAPKTCTATFTQTTTAGVTDTTVATLTVTLVSAVSQYGTGEGRVTSQPAGIDCGSDCSEPYERSTKVTLTAVAMPGSEFVGWTGASCPPAGSCVLNLTTDTAVTASFAPRTAMLTVKPPQGGLILGPGIDCGSVCTATYRYGTRVTLRAMPETAFTGWEGAACNDSPQCDLQLAADHTVSARFKARSHIGVFRPQTGEWFLDLAGTGEWERAQRVGPWDPTHGQGIPLVGEWTAGSGATLSIYDPNDHTWYVDNGNDRWEGCDVDTCTEFAPIVAGDVVEDAKPVGGDWRRSGRATIGIFDATSGSWYLDDGNRRWDGCGIDSCYAGERADIVDLNHTIESLLDQMDQLNVQQRGTNDKQTKKQIKHALKAVKKQLKRSRKQLKKLSKRLKKAEKKRRKAGHGEAALVRAVRIGQQDGTQVVPLAASFSSDGPAIMGAFYPRNGAWEFDRNGNGKFDGCNVDLCFSEFAHQANDLPVVGDWNGLGVAEIGLFRPASGEWLLDYNGNGRWDGCEIDACLGPFGSSGDVPVTGEW